MAKSTTSSSVEELLVAPIDLQRLLDRLDFGDDDIDRCVLEQASLFMKASVFYVQTMRARIIAESRYDRAKAEIAVRLREKKRASERGGGLTEGAIKERVLRFPAVVLALKKLNRAIVREELAEQLVAAYRQRRDALRVHVMLLQTEMSGEMRITQQQVGRKKLAKLSSEVTRQRWPRSSEEEEDD
jgi:hypothetical protein